MSSRRIRTCNGCRALVLHQKEGFTCALGFQIDQKQVRPVLPSCPKPKTNRELIDYAHLTSELRKRSLLEQER